MYEPKVGKGGVHLMTCTCVVCVEADKALMMQDMVTTGPTRTKCCTDPDIADKGPDGGVCLICGTWVDW